MFLHWPYVANRGEGPQGKSADLQMDTLEQATLPSSIGQISSCPSPVSYQRRGSISWAPFCVCSFTQAVGALCANAADAGEGRGDGPEGRGDPGQTVNGSRRSRGPTGLTKASVFRFAPCFLQTVLLILRTSTKGRFSHLKTKAGRTD